ncbi:hypothetical protein ACF073_20770 [Streptomyces sp. NPDC015171]|uniref:DUF7848 domain-containing protein n=1 Tax=Streptomyces sp. NPDC015171 TaxID=3364945 RepID=UPI00370054D9
MSTQARRKFAFFNWTLRPDRDEDAPLTMYASRCLTLNDDDTECAKESPPSKDPTDPQGWTFGHMRTHPEHTSCAEVIERPWVMWRQGPT